MLLSEKNSIKRSLFIYLASLITLVVFIIGLASFFSTKYEIQKLFDANMINSAKLLAGMMKYEQNENKYALHEVLGKFLHNIKQHKYERKIHYQIWIDEDLIYNSDDKITLPKPDIEGFSDITINKKLWRSFAMRQEKISVIALEEYEIRHELIAKILIFLLVAFTAAVPAIIIIIWLIIDKKLAPIKIISQKISDMSPEKLKTFDDLSTPSEIKPFLDSLNSLLLRLADSMESERRFTDYAAHELRTPIAVIKTQSQLLLRNKNKEKEKEYLDDLIAAVDRIDHLINQILTLSRLEPESGIISKENIDIKNLLEILVGQYQKLSDHKISLQTEIAPLLKGNRIYLEIMLGNLIDNAIKYSEKNSEIKIKLEEKNSHLFLSITNKGKPLNKEEQQKIFERFYRVKGNEQVGCGLGLAIAKKIAELHGGNIIFKSKDGENIVEMRL